MAALTAIATGLGAASTLASSILGAVGSAKANKRANALIDNAQKENESWYDRQMSRDYTRRAENQAILKRQRELLDEYYNRSASAQAVTGGTDEAVAMSKASANDALAKTMTNIAAQSTAQKDAAEQQYLANKATLTQQQIAAQQAKAQQVATAAGQGISAGLNLLGSTIAKENA